MVLKVPFATLVMFDPSRKKYTLDYYLDLTEQLVNHGIDILAIKDMMWFVEAARYAYHAGVRFASEIPSLTDSRPHARYSFHWSHPCLLQQRLELMSSTCAQMPWLV